MIPHINVHHKNAVDHIIHALQSIGAVKITGITHVSEATAIAKKLGGLTKNQDTGEEVTYLKPIASDGANNQRALTRCCLYPHTDRSPIQNPPDLLMLCCQHPAPNQGGVSILADGFAIMKDMRNHDYQHYRALQEPNSAIFCDGVSSYKGSIVENLQGWLNIRFRLDEYGFYNANIMAAVSVLQTYIKKHRFILTLTTGEAYIINNKRWLHGRTAFEGERIVYRILINAFDPLFKKGFMLENEPIYA